MNDWREDLAKYNNNFKHYSRFDRSDLKSPKNFPRHARSFYTPSKLTQYPLNLTRNRSQRLLEDKKVPIRDSRSNIPRRRLLGTSKSPSRPSFSRFVLGSRYGKLLSPGEDFSTDLEQNGLSSIKKMIFEKSKGFGSKEQATNDVLDYVTMLRQENENRNYSSQRIGNYKLKDQLDEKDTLFARLAEEKKLASFIYPNFGEESKSSKSKENYDRSKNFFLY